MSSVKVAIKNIGQFVQKKQRQIAFEVYGGLIAVTPKDTSRAASSWRMKVDAVDPSSEPAGQSSYSPKPADIGLMSPNSVIFVTNNVPYIIPLNNGHSQQAGKFFIQKEIKQAIKRGLAKVDSV